MRRTLFAIFSLIAIASNLLAEKQAYGSERSLLLQEAERQLSYLQTSTYQHHTDVNEVSGRYDYDCSGFLDYSLQRTEPEAYAELPISKLSAKRPLAQDYYTLFSSRPQRSSHWLQIRKATHLHAGDIVVWLRPSDNDSNNTGHVMLVRGEPMINPNQPNEILVQVIDSTSSPHAQDSRHRGQTGLGTGVIGILIDGNNEPIGYHWRGALSQREEETAIAFGRLRSR